MIESNKKHSIEETVSGTDASLNDLSLPFNKDLLSGDVERMRHDRLSTIYSTSRDLLIDATEELNTRTGIRENHVESARQLFTYIADSVEFREMVSKVDPQLVDVLEDSRSLLGDSPLGLWAVLMEEVLPPVSSHLARKDNAIYDLYSATPISSGGEAVILLTDNGSVYKASPLPHGGDLRELMAKTEHEARMLEEFAEYGIRVPKVLGVGIGAYNDEFASVLHLEYPEKARTLQEILDDPFTDLSRLKTIKEDAGLLFEKLSKAGLYHGDAAEIYSVSVKPSAGQEFAELATGQRVRLGIRNVLVLPDDTICLIDLSRAGADVSGERARREKANLDLLIDLAMKERTTG